MTNTLKKMAQTLREQGDYDAAANILQKEIDRLEEALSHHVRESRLADRDEISIAAEVVDLYGILGGTRRKQGNILSAAVAYDAGFHYESNPYYRFINSYNELNRLVMRVLLCPDSLSDPEAVRQVRGLEFVDVRHGLSELQSHLAGQVKSVRSNDYWAAGDLALTSALNGDDQAMLNALQLFASLSPPQSAFHTYRDIVDTLAHLKTKSKGSLIRTVAWLEAKIKEGSDKG